MLLLAAALASCGAVHAQDAATVERSATLKSMFPEQTANQLAVTLDPDTVVRFRIRVPKADPPGGILVFVKPVDSGDLPKDWATILDRKNLIWIAADDFGNRRPSAQRVLVALMALKLVQNTQAFDAKRVYVGGMSGGGRIASTIMTRFPQRFAGALYIVGADPWTEAEQPLIPRIARNRYVFVTGSRDFNQGEMKRLFAKYQAAGMTQAMLMDLPGFGHEYPDAEQFGKAIDFLDARQAAR
ncbi:MAG TPA: PHB depolymerase family esterase [Steroidobacteraceae bacterium]|jgi:hypothetical protein|nr:PHB depolymerase family esterase [Steroidobacteraceae bacterium]